MKINIDRYMMMALACALMLAAGCSREENLPAEGPDALAAFLADGILETRTSYDGVDGKFKWNDGDQIKVHYQDGRFETMDIAVDASDPSKAIVLSSVVGTKVRDFYAVYPASVAVTPASGATAPKVNLPDSYDISAIVAGSSPLTWDYSPVPLVAENVPGEDLQFHHVGGLLRVICRDLVPATKKVVVRFDKDVTGTYSVNVTDPDEPFIACSDANTGKNTVTFTVASAAAGVGSSVTALTLNVPIPCGTYGNLQVEAQNNAGETLFVREYRETGMTFGRHHGKRIAFAEETVEFVMDADLEPVTTDADGGIGVLVNNSFTSFGRNEDGDTYPIPFALEYGPTASGPWTREAPAWLTPGAGIDFNGGERPQRIEVAVAQLENLVDLNRNGIPQDDDHTIRLQNAREKEDFDLSTLNVATGGQVSRTTANCYVVQAAGTYRFPVAYGNAIQNGSPVESSYHAIGRDVDEQTINSECMLLGYYKDHLDQDIHYPYVADQLYHKSPALSISEAKLLWMDAPGLIKDVQYHPGSAGNDYISFQIEKADICQGNAVIAVFDNNTPKRIAWSWHIWVTDEDLTVKKAGGLPDKYLSTTNLGYCNTRKMEEYADRSCYVRLVQDIPDGKVSDAVQIFSAAAPTVIRYANSTFYNWGRKDPFPGGDGNLDAPADKLCYPTTGNDYYPLFGVNETVSLGKAIQNPHIQHIGDWVVWSSPTYANCWASSLSQCGTDELPETVKTVYDPCPVGFKVPSEQMLKYLFTTRNKLPPFVWQNRTADGREPGILRESDGLFFPALGCRGQALDAVGFGGYYESANACLERAWDRFVWDRTRFNEAEEASCGSATNVALMVRPMFE